MNDSNYNLEQQIKKQIEEREITPSRDLWSEIEIQNMNFLPVKPKMNWFLVAACFLLLASLSLILLFNKEKTIDAEIAKIEIQPQNKNIEKSSTEEISLVKSEKIEHFNTNNKNLVSSEKIESSKPTSVPKEAQSLLQIETKKQIAAKTRENLILNTQILASTDSVTLPKKRKKYVDASTLLFSVEHKDVIENSKDGSNVATIDLNSK